MFTSIDELVKRFKWETKMTGSFLDQFSDQSLKQRINDEHRNIGRIVWHIITIYPEMLGATGIPIEIVRADSPILTSAKEMARIYRAASREAIDFISENWTDDTLQIEDSVYECIWPRGKTVMVFLLHEVHHRGQLTVLMRQAGLVVPSTYGPAKEGWAEEGQPIPLI